MFKQSIKFKPDLFELVLKRKKMSTVRKGLRDYTLGDVLLETDPPRFTIHGEIIKLEKRCFYELTEEDAIIGGYNCLADLKERLKQIYPDIDNHEVITIVGFDHAE